MMILMMIIIIISSSTSSSKIKRHSGTEYAMHKQHKGSCKSIKDEDGK